MQASNKMKILLLGATGRTGKLVLEKALNSGYEVNCLSRNTGRLEKRHGLTVFEGNPAKKDDLEKAITDCDKVISTLNISRKSDFPWSGLRTPENFLSDVMRLLVRISEEKEVQRIVICSAWGVAETKKDIPKWFNWLIENSNIGVAYKDHERQERILTDSNLRWTIVRPVGLINSDREKKIRETFGNSPRPRLTISRQNVANYLISSLKEERLVGKKVEISGE